MALLSNLFIVLILKCICIAQATLNTEGYIVHPDRSCPGNNFLGGYFFENSDKCRGICEAHALCVGFEYRPLTGINCWPKSVCDTLMYDGAEWTTTYKKIPGRGGCTFDGTPGFALYGHNDDVIESTNLDNCKKKCVLDMKCLSFDYKNMTDTCFISHDSRETKPTFFNEHYVMTYYHRRCGPEVDHVPTDVLKASGGATIWMKDGQCIKSYGPYGGKGGGQFSDADKMYANITAVVVRHSVHIDSIAFKYGTSTMQSYGGTGGTEVSTELHSGERITGVEGRYGWIIYKLLFITNQRTIGPFGSDSGTEFSVDSGGKPLLYISGARGYYVDRLSFHFTC